MAFCGVKLRESPGCDFARKLGENDRDSANEVGGQSSSKTRFGDDEFIWSFSKVVSTHLWNTPLNLYQ